MRRFRQATCIAAALIAAGLTPSPLSSQGRKTGLDAPRQAFIACIKKSAASMLQVEGANPRAFNYFTALSCSAQRDAYQAALVSAGYPDVDQMMRRVDVAATLYLRNTWAAHPGAPRK